jgi:hypothetical protein
MSVTRRVEDALPKATATISTANPDETLKGPGFGANPEGWAFAS